MNAIEIAVVVVVGALFVAAIAYLLVCKLKHKGGCNGCGGSCANCSGCSGKTHQRPKTK